MAPPEYGVASVWPLRLMGFSTSLSSLPMVRISSRICGDSTVLLPEAKSGFLFASTIWMDRPSTVISSRIWSRRASRAGTFMMDASSRSLSFCSFTSFFLSLPFVMPLLTWPSLRVRSVPPPGTGAVASPTPAPPISDSFSGCWKYSEMPFRVFSLAELSSHISRKKAIMAVTKSA